MRPLLRALALAAMLFMLLSCGVSQQPPQAAPATPTASVAATPEQSPCAKLPPPAADTQFPPNFDYPQTPDTIASWRNDRNGHATMRNHAYCLFAGLNLPVMGVPAWRRWQTSTQAFPYQYNQWIAHAPDGSPLEQSDTSHPATINESRNEAVGRIGDILNPAPIYVINDALAGDPRYRQCRQAKYDENKKFLGYTLRDGEMFQSNGDIMIAVVSYNEAALKNIQNTGLNTNLYDAAKLDARLPKQAGDNPTTIGDFPFGSIVLKVMYWPVAGGQNIVSALPVWNWDANKPGSPSDGQYAGYELQKFWTNAVAISSAPTTAQTANVTFLYGVLDANENKLNPNTYNGAPVVGLDRFYRKTFSQTEFDLLSPCDQALLHASAYWAYNRAFMGGDSLVMIAMHVMTKEQPDWTFQSAWWHPDARDHCPPNSTDFHRFCGDQPASTPSADESWRNYMMVTTYGMLQIPPDGGGGGNYYAPPDTKDRNNVWPVAYNPYIELAASHPITTNCMNCHHRAAWPPDVPDQKPDRGRFSAYLQITPVNPNALESFTTSDGPFKGLLMLDSMWGVSDRAGYREVTSTAKAP
jgi:hypothetical protein